jgi:hypothetical protein
MSRRAWNYAMTSSEVESLRSTSRSAELGDRWRALVHVDIGDARRMERQSERHAADASPQARILGVDNREDRLPRGVRSPNG